MAFTCFLTDAMAANDRISPLEKRNKLKTGDYLLADFQKELKKSQSLYFAVNFPEREEQDPATVSIDHSGGNLELGISDAWHDGFDMAIREDGTVTAAVEDYAKQTVFQVLDDSHFVFGAKDMPGRTYNFVGDNETYFADLILRGRYADDQGQIYVFGADGWAIFPDETFKYNFYLDTVLNGSDQFWDETHNKYYAFKRGGDDLEIVEAPEQDLVEPDWAHTLLSLHRIGP